MKSNFRKNPRKNIVETQTAKTRCFIPWYGGSFLFVHTIKEVQASMVHLKPKQWRSFPIEKVCHKIVDYLILQLCLLVCLNCFCFIEKNTAQIFANLLFLIMILVIIITSVLIIIIIVIIERVCPRGLLLLLPSRAKHRNLRWRHKISELGSSQYRNTQIQRRIQIQNYAHK